MTLFTFHPDTGFISCHVDNEMAESAIKNLNKRTVSNNKTFSSEKGSSYAGSLGEEAVIRYFGDRYKPHNNMSFDGLLKGRDGKFYKIDIKTKSQANPPKLNFEQSVPVYSSRQQTPDFYFFVSAIKSRTFNGEYDKIYIVGFLPSAAIKKAESFPNPEDPKNEIYLRKKGTMIDCHPPRPAKNDDWVFKVSSLIKLNGLSS